MNLLDWLAIIQAFATYTRLSEIVEYTASSTVMLYQGQMTMALANRSFQQALGLASFLAIFKGDPPLPNACSV